MNHDEFIHKVLASGASLSIGNKPLLVALSGGADSVALLRVLLEVGCKCFAAHCNFHLRDDESTRDEQFVRELCQRLEVPLAVKDFDVAAWQQLHGGSVEMACRTLRYQWFEQERIKQNCALIAVAHHADDQVETFFLNLLRGTGVKGLTGMERLNHKIWRPLLSVTRNDILDYLESIGQDFVTDSTNAQNDYSRNRLRNIVLPAIGEQFDHANQRILHTMDNLNRDYELITSLVEQVIPDEHHIDIDELCRQAEAPSLLYHRIRHLGFNRTQCDKAIEAARLHHSGSKFIGNGHLLIVNRQSIDIEAIKTEEDISININLNSNLLSPVHITISHNNAPFSPKMCDGKHNVAFNRQLLQCQSVVLRHWRKGDRIKPFGMKGSKLVSDLFNDLKLDHKAKREAWLLEADEDILWVIGYRASSLYPVEPESQDYILFHL